jgi:hypothetical protein
MLLSSRNTGPVCLAEVDENGLVGRSVNVGLFRFGKLQQSICRSAAEEAGIYLVSVAF